MQAEREARIAAELAELGDTDRVLEERALKKLLRPLGLAIREIPPDGHCLYRSLEDQLRQQGSSGNGSGAPAAEGQGGGAAAGGPAGAGQTFLELRAAAADYMRRHADHFMPFVLEVGGVGALLIPFLRAEEVGLGSVEQTNRELVLS